MDAAALVDTKSPLASLKHNDALATDQVNILRLNRNGLVTDQVLQNLVVRAYGLRCDGSHEEGAYEADLQMAINEMEQTAGTPAEGTAEPVAGQQWRPMPVAASLPSSMWEKENASALATYVASGHQHHELVHEGFRRAGELCLLLPSRKHPPGSRADDDNSDREGNGSDGDAHEALTTLDIDDDLTENEEALPLEIPTGYIHMSW